MSKEKHHHHEEHKHEEHEKVQNAVAQENEKKENEGKIVHIGYIFDVTNQVLITLSSDVGNVTTSSYLFRAYTFADGSPFGIKKE